MSIALDLIIIGIILLSVVISAKRGFVKAAVEAAGFIAAVAVAFTVSSPLASITYDKIIEPPIVDAAINTVGESAEHNAFNALPDFITENNLLREEIAPFTEKITQNLSQGTEAAVKTAAQEIVKPIATKVLGLLYTIILILVLMIVVRLLARFLNKIFSFSLVGKLNRFLGGTVGVVKGVLYAAVFCGIISLILSFTGKPLLIFTEENINNSYIFKIFTEIISF